LLDSEDKYVTANKIKGKFKHKVAMYHGTITNSKVDSGLVMGHGLNKDIFDGFDLVLLGDIHCQQIMNEDWVDEIEVSEVELETYSKPVSQLN